ncbi:MAG TPA: hypothetical protein VNW95_14380 [Mucilaginibacter sp.]|jgi:hypothetical protein|nr:hypothetical protein [Mucilaginibacter sp.]
MKILKQNSKGLLKATLLFVVVLSQNCKKGAANAPAALPTQGMYALINDTAWTASTVTASLAYNRFSTSKTFTCTGTTGSRMIQLIASQNDVAAGSDFPVGPANSNLDSFNYFVLPIHRSLAEQTTTPGTTVGTSLVITAIDSAKRLISGTFTFPSLDSAYDANGNVISVQKNRITNGFFKQVHYVYTQ